MEKYYLTKKIQNFKEVVVISVSRGDPLVRFSNNIMEQIRILGEAMSIYRSTPKANGVSVTHDVVLVIPNNVNAEQLYEKDAEAVQEAADTLVSCTEECPNFNITAEPTVNKTEANLELACGHFVEDPDVAQYYQPLPIDGTIACVTVCHIQHSHHKRCYNKGVCKVYKVSGPFCECHDVDGTWYLRDDCSFPVQKIAFYAGICLTFACLLLVVGVLIAFRILRSEKWQRRNRAMTESMVHQWLDEDIEWSRSNSDIHSAGDLDNPCYTYDGSSFYREDQGFYIEPVFQQSQPSSHTRSNTLDTEYPLSDTPYGHSTLTTTTLSFSNVGLSQSSLPQPQRDFSSNQPMRIRRPQIRTSGNVGTMQ
ncbi:mucin-17-like [Pempheris klunzingeri]|uniref:mucin-17-like n=1 Tax=Pempheris klunzingeri TaxID=3127111 RepID=UPI0039803F4E